MAPETSAPNPSASPSHSSSTHTIDDGGSLYGTEFIEGIPYTRKRPSPSQTNSLQSSYDTNPYPTREERLALADEIGMQYTAVTNWFQNRRQSRNRKAWSAAARDRRRARAKQAAQRPSSSLMAGLSLDHVASLLERRSNSPTPRRTVSSASSLSTPQKRRTISASSLLDHMASSPPESPSSPFTEGIYSIVPSGMQTKTKRSLEWACARARVDRKLQRRDKENRPLKRSTGQDSGSSKALWSRMSSAPELERRDGVIEEKEYDSETEVEPDEVLTPGRTTSMSTVRTRSFSQDSSVEESTAGMDMEAAMMLLGFTKGSREHGQGTTKSAEANISSAQCHEA